MSGEGNPDFAALLRIMAAPGERVQRSMAFTAPAFPATTVSVWKMVDEHARPSLPHRTGIWCKGQVVSI